jgi:hypothetical protein
VSGAVRLGSGEVVTTTEQILAQLRKLTPAERLRVVEQVIHEVAAELAPPPPFSSVKPIWSDESDADFEAFRDQLRALRLTDVWRTGD